eukprot:354083-Chlamydomonas_euryale.AAC.2
MPTCMACGTLHTVTSSKLPSGTACKKMTDLMAHPQLGAATGRRGRTAVARSPLLLRGVTRANTCVCRAAAASTCRGLRRVTAA